MKVRDERRQGQETVRPALQGGMCVLHSSAPPLAFSVLRTATLARQGLSAAVRLDKSKVKWVARV